MNMMFYKDKFTNTKCKTSLVYIYKTMNVLQKKMLCFYYYEFIFILFDFQYKYM